MKRILAGIVLVAFYAVSSWGQNNGGSATQPPPGTISSGSASSVTGTNLAANSNGNITLTNTAGGAFTVEQLGSQIQSLRTMVEQTLPMLTAFNERYAASQPGATLGRTIQNIFSGNKNQQGGRTAGTEITNVLAALGALVSTNQNQSVSPNTLQDLATLQKDLQPVQQVLQNLSFTTSGTNQTVAPSGGVPSPTGR